MLIWSTRANVQFGTGHGEQASRLCGGAYEGRWQQWMPLVISSQELLCYAQAYSAVGFFRFLGPETFDREIWSLKQRAIHRVNLSLQDPNFAVHAANIGAVLCMVYGATLENMSKEDYITHMSGLQRMLMIRGGLPALSSNTLIYDLAVMADFLGANIYGLPLFFDHSSSGLIFDSPDFLASLACPKAVFSPLFAYPGGFDEHVSKRIRELAPSVLRILECMRTVTALFEASEGSETIILNCKVAKQCKDMETIIGMCTNINFTRLSSSGQAESNADLEESCRLASLIYFSAMVDNIPFNSHLHMSTLDRLQKTVGRSVLGGWNHAPGLLLWVLLVGTAAERRRDKDMFFAGHLCTTCLCVGIRHFGDVRNMLVKFLWIEKTIRARAKSASTTAVTNKTDRHSHFIRRYLLHRRSTFQGKG
ncbi:MAG: hypothetical protein Q9191_007212 [Dirinaria sp. TL-2023a]